MASPPAILAMGSGQLEVELLPEVGARLHRIRAFGYDLLRTPPHIDAHREAPIFWGAYPMAPWCNRARPGRRHVAGRSVDLAPNFDDGSAIHGVVGAVPWKRRGTGSLGLEVDAGRWPWGFDIQLDIELEQSALGLRYRLVNQANAPMPAGLGLHPWFRTPLEVRLPARAVYRSNIGSAPVPEPVDGPFDLARRATPAADLDATWTGLDEQTIELAWPDAGIVGLLSVETSAPAVLVALASPATLDAVAIEPQTHGPDALRRLASGEADAPIMLPPGAALTLDLRLEVALARNLR